MYLENEFGDTIQSDISNIDYSCEFILMVEDKYFKRTNTIISAKREINKYRGKKTTFVKKQD